MVYRVYGVEFMVYGTEYLDYGVYGIIWYRVNGTCYEVCLVCLLLVLLLGFHSLRDVDVQSLTFRRGSEVTEFVAMCLLERLAGGRGNSPKALKVFGALPGLQKYVTQMAQRLQSTSPRCHALTYSWASRQATALLGTSQVLRRRASLSDEWIDSGIWRGASSPDVCHGVEPWPSYFCFPKAILLMLFRTTQRLCLGYDLFSSWGL